MPRRTPWRFARSLAKWACTVATVGLLTTMFASFRWHVVACTGSASPYVFACASGGWLDATAHHWHGRHDIPWRCLNVSDTRRLPPDLASPGIFDLQHAVCSMFGGSLSVATPLWLPALVFALPAAFLWWRDSPGRRRRRAMRRNECVACGYSLAGITPGSECPECGSKSAAEKPPG